MGRTRIYCEGDEECQGTLEGSVTDLKYSSSPIEANKEYHLETVHGRRRDLESTFLTPNVKGSRKVALNIFNLTTAGLDDCVQRLHLTAVEKLQRECKHELC